jgi:hypothetical protein
MPIDGQATIRELGRNRRLFVNAEANPQCGYGFSFGSVNVIYQVFDIFHVDAMLQ